MTNIDLSLCQGNTINRLVNSGPAAIQPVAWVVKTTGRKQIVVFDYDEVNTLLSVDLLATAQPLYTTQSPSEQGKPLSDEQIDSAIRLVWSPDISTDDFGRDLARQVERMHGIL